MKFFDNSTYNYLQNVNLWIKNLNTYTDNTRSYLIVILSNQILIATRTVVKSWSFKYPYVSYRLNKEYDNLNC
jgi:hypothetical protein